MPILILSKYTDYFVKKETEMALIFQNQDICFPGVGGGSECYKADHLVAFRIGSLWQHF